MVLILKLLLQHGIWNENDYKVFKCIIKTCKSMNQYVCQNKSLSNRLLGTLLVFKEVVHENIIKTHEQWFELNHVRHGEYKNWYEHGQLYMQKFYVNGLRHGISRIWYTTGQLHSQVCYVNGQMEGDFKTWDMTGQERSYTRHTFLKWCGMSLE